MVESGSGTKLIMRTFFLAGQAEVECKKVPKGEGQRCNLSLLSCIEVQHSESKIFSNRSNWIFVTLNKLALVRIGEFELVDDFLETFDL